MFKLQIWGFIVGQYVTISEHPTKEAAYTARDEEKKRRDGLSMYTDLGTFKIDGPAQ